jgi:2-polyprenyl-6-methoxyphenol hydroxylase-like FAD-dependent oxidoreductase
MLESIVYDDEKPTVTAVFEDGTKATGTLLIGADGAQSRARYSILGDKGQPSKVPYSAVNLHVCYNDAEKALFVRKAHPISKSSGDQKAICPGGEKLTNL